MISEEHVFDSVRRGYSELSTSSHEDIIAYFEDIESESSIGHTNNIKGILFEQIYIEQLADQGINASVFENTNHPAVDIAIIDDGSVAYELQLKATDSASYISSTLQENPEVTIVTTSEVANSFASDAVINSGISNSALDEAVSNTIFEDTINPFGPFTLLRWLIGIPF